MKPIILASQSPSRQKILSQMGFEFQTIPSNADEEFDLKKSIKQNATILAEKKANEVFKRFPHSIVIGSDTIMIDPIGNFLEKPKDKNDAIKMMRNRSGKVEKIVSGICIISSDKKILETEETKIFWKNLSETEIEKIIGTNEWQGKCGGVMIEGFTGYFIEKIEGSYHNVMGFPVSSFWQAIKQF